jgi:hypothetical protein
MGNVLSHAHADAAMPTPETLKDGQQQQPCDVPAQTADEAERLRQEYTVPLNELGDDDCL